MTSAFQWVFDRAENISINRKPVVAQTQSRNNIVRSVSRGGAVWRFSVKMPDGIPWTQSRSYIEALSAADRFTPGTVSLSNPGYSDWLSAYQGNVSTTSGFTVTSNLTNTVTIQTVPGVTLPGQTLFGSGDFIQLGTGHVYSVVTPVTYSGSPGQTVTLNRPVIDVAGTHALTVGPAVTFTVLCVSMPDWQIFARDQVSWSGAFEFQEVIA